jgi:hypothetical protein
MKGAPVDFHIEDTGAATLSRVEFGVHSLGVAAERNGVLAIASIVSTMWCFDLGIQLRA